MKVKEIYDFINSIAPFDTAGDWDNVGLLVGEASQDVTCAVVALDCTAEAVELAKKAGAQLIITHHPVIFNAMKSVTADTVAWQLAKVGISVISAHTNLDKAKDGVNCQLCRAIGLDASPAELNPLFVIGELDNAVDAKDYIAFVKKALGCEVIRAYIANNSIKKVAVCCGNGGDFLDAARLSGCDTLLTGDVKHNVFIDAAHKGMNLIDAGHFATEDVVVEPLAEMLRERFPEVDFITDHTAPFNVF